MSSPRPPTPVCHAFVLCRRLIVDQITKERVIFAPLHEVHLPTFPTILEVSVFARLSSLNGRYLPGLQLHSLEGEVVWREDFEQPAEVFDPLKACVFDLHARRIYVPRPGKFEVVFLMNGEPVHRDTLHVAPTPPPAPPRPRG